jgi:hypothetical protein
MSDFLAPVFLLLGGMGERQWMSCLQVASRFSHMLSCVLFSLSVLQAHFSRAELPISDYITHLKSVLDQRICIIKTMIDICANIRWLKNALTCMHLLQMIIQVSSSVMNSRHCLPSSSVFATLRCSM